MTGMLLAGIGEHSAKKGANYFVVDKGTLLPNDANANRYKGKGGGGCFREIV